MAIRPFHSPAQIRDLPNAAPSSPYPDGRFLRPVRLNNPKKGHGLPCPYSVTFVLFVAKFRPPPAHYSSNHINFAGLSFNMILTSSGLMPKPKSARIKTRMPSMVSCHHRASRICTDVVAGVG